MKMNFKRKLLAVSLPIVLVSTAAIADQVFLDDVIIDGSLCTGVDCVNGESFGFDTIRLKENNLRIKFQDTSASASFPTVDWQLTANDSTNGGANKFSIDNIDTGATPFTILSGAPSNSLYVNAAGDVGLGTASPAVDAHIVSGNTPTLRLEQNGSSGFTPQTFDVAANEANFFVRDVTNGSALSFRIKPGADQNSLVVAANNDIGVGTESPASSLHVRRADGSAKIAVEEASGTKSARALISLTNNGNPEIEFNNTANSNIWKIGAGKRVVMNNNGGANVFTLEANGDLALTGVLTTAGTTCGTGCDKVFEEGYELPSIEEHAEAMWSQGYLPNVGPTIENEPINVTDKVGRMLNELEKAHIYIDQLNDENKMLKARLDALEARLQ